MQITAHNLTKRYGATLVVDDVSFSVHPGRVTGFLGPNGAGKSTTMRMLLGLHRPHKGRVDFDGKPLTDYPNPLRVVGSLLDAKAFDPRNTPVQHLRAQAATHGIGRDRVDEVIDLTGLASVAGKRIGTFSLGMGQRLGIANAILADPQVLVLDEPINGLDPDGVRWVRDTLRNFAAEGRTVLLSSHLMGEMAQTADHIIVIGRGRILADAPVAKILASSGPATRIRSDRLHELLSRLPGSIGEIEIIDETAAVVAGLNSTDLGLIAAQHNIALGELTPIQSSLEDAYLDLTADAVEYKTGASA